MLGDLVMHCQSVSVGMLKAHFFNYIAEGMSESKEFEMRLRSEILERDPKRFVSEEERREEVTQALLRVRGFTLERGGADWSLPDLISKEEGGLKCPGNLAGWDILGVFCLERGDKHSLAACFT